MTPTPNPTAEQIVADAITAYWADEERSGPNRGPLAHDFACGEAATAALRAAGLLSGGAPSEEQIERAARALFEDPHMSADYTWAEMVEDDPTRAEIWRIDARRALTAAGVAPQARVNGVATSPEPVKNGGDSLHVDPQATVEEALRFCTCSHWLEAHHERECLEHHCACKNFQPVLSPQEPTSERCDVCSDKLDYVAGLDGEGCYPHCWRCWYKDHPVEAVAAPLDPEKVAEVIEAASMDWQFKFDQYRSETGSDPGPKADYMARAFCVSYTEGKLT